MNVVGVWASFFRAAFFGIQQTCLFQIDNFWLQLKLAHTSYPLTLELSQPLTPKSYLLKRCSEGKERRLLFISDNQILQQLLANKIPHTASKSQGDPARKKRKEKRKKEKARKEDKPFRRRQCPGGSAHWLSMRPTLQGAQKWNFQSL